MIIIITIIITLLIQMQVNTHEYQSCRWDCWSLRSLDDVSPYVHTHARAHAGDTWNKKSLKAAGEKTKYKNETQVKTALKTTCSFWPSYFWTITQKALTFPRRGKWNSDSAEFKFLLCKRWNWLLSFVNTKEIQSRRWTDMQNWPHSKMMTSLSI